MEDDTIEFNAVDTFFFNPAKSYPLTGQEEITFPNVLLLGMAIAVSWDRAPMLPLISEAIDVRTAQRLPYLQQVPHSHHPPVPE